MSKNRSLVVNLSLVDSPLQWHVLVFTSNVQITHFKLRVNIFCIFKGIFAGLNRVCVSHKYLVTFTPTNMDMLYQLTWTCFTSEGRWTSMGVYEGQYPIVRMLTVSSMLLDSLWFCIYCVETWLIILMYKRCNERCTGVCCKNECTCLNWIIMSLDNSMSLNIPSSLLVNAAPHSASACHTVCRW